MPVGVDWQICHQIANHQKHVRTKLVKNPNSPVIKSVQVASGNRGFVLPGSVQVIGAGEHITVEFETGNESALSFTIRTSRHFHYIFEVIPLPLAKRTAASAMTPQFFGV